MLRINPSSINNNPLKRDALIALISQYPSKVYFDGTYCLDFTDHENNQSYSEIELTHRIVKRACNPEGKNKGQFRYEVLSNQRPLASGAFSSLLGVKGVLVLSDQGRQLTFKIKEDEEQRVVKRLALNNEDITKETIEREYALTPSHMHMKPPVFTKHHSFLFMRRKTGLTLDIILRNDYLEKQILSAEQRYSLGEAILDAIQKQVHDKKIIHRDLKPENILAHYNQETKNWVITIADFGLAKAAGTFPAKDSVGTSSYASPEVFSQSGTTEKSDVYAAGCILSEIFGCRRSLDELGYAELFEERQNDGIFLGLLLESTPESDTYPKGRIAALIKHMTRMFPADRCTISIALEELQAIASEHQNIRTVTSKRL